jgi:ABC-type phosphate/phosphonate transport system ATPase subunit
MDLGWNMGVIVTEKNDCVDKPEIVLLVEREIKSANLVILIGGICSGKSWLINQLFSDTEIIDKSIYAPRGDYAEVSIKSLDKWAARINRAIAIDEIQLLQQKKS